MNTTHEDPAYTAEADGNTPAEAALLLGLAVPPHLHDAIRELIISTEMSVDTDGTNGVVREWRRGPLYLCLAQRPDGAGYAYLSSDEKPAE